MQFLRHILRHCLTLILLLAAAAAPLKACVPGMGSGRVEDRRVVLILEDHGGMREVVWDAAFKELSARGPFQADHRYVLRTTSRPALIDFGCWDGAWDNDGACRNHHDCGDRRDSCGHRDGDTHRRSCAPDASVPSCDWVPGRAGVILSYGGHATWLPVTASCDGDEFPGATFRGAYLNWLLQNRGTTPSIPTETRWQRVQRGSTVLVQDFLSTAKGDPHVLLVAVGTSGRLLIPPTESASFALAFARSMAPSDRGTSLDGALDEALDTVRKMHPAGSCLPGLFLVASDGYSLGRDCGSGRPYESLSSYPDLLRDAAAIPATGQATLWTWSVDGPRPWASALAAQGAGSTFAGDAVPALDAAVRTWVAAQGAPLQLTLAFDQASPTRADKVTLTVQANHSLTSLTLNGKSVAVKGFTASIPLTLAEGVNTFAVSAQDACGNRTTGTSVITLDRKGPRIVITTPAPGTVTSANPIPVTGTVDDPTATLTLNGQSVPLSGTSFSAAMPAPVGPFTITAVATDPLGNASTAAVTVTVVRTAPHVAFTAPAEGLLTNAATLTVTGTVDDATATVFVNGRAANVSGGAFTITLAPGEGTLVLNALATNAAGLTGTAVRTVTIDRTAPGITVTSSVPLLTNLPGFPLTAKVDDPGARLALNGKALPFDGTGLFTGDVLLGLEGINAIRLEATDAAGNTRTLDLFVVRDTQPPAVAISAPADGLRTHAATLTVTGTTDASATQVLVNGTVATLADAAFSATLAPAEGPLTVTATASDPAGNTAKASVSVVIDRTAPVITVTSPVPALTKAMTLALTGAVDKPVASLTVNGSPAVVSGLSFTAQAALGQEGANPITLVATDLAGNVGTLTLQTTRDTTPVVLRILSPQDGFATADALVEIKGSVDDPAATVTVQGTAATVDAQGTFTATVGAPSRQGRLPIQVQATDPAGNVTNAQVTVNFDRTPPVLAWLDPTPAEGARLTQASLSAAVAVSKTAVTSINGRRVELEPGDSLLMPFKARAEVSLQEGNVTLTASAVDGAGNSATLTRTLAVGLTAPRITVSSPAFDASGRFTTANVGATLIGRVEAPDFVRPLVLTVNGAPATLNADGSFSLPMTLFVGDNTAVLTASTAYGQTDSRTFVVTRAAGTPDAGTAPGISLDWPQQGFATSTATVTVKGRVLVAGMRASLNGTPVTVDPQTLVFSAPVTLQPGANIIGAQGSDAQGRTATASVTGTYVPQGTATTTWLSPLAGTHTSARTVAVTGRATQPGIVSVTVNGVSMALDPAAGTFTGTVALQSPGPNALALVATPLDGTSYQEQRIVSYEPALPQVVLAVPGSARPGDAISIQVTPGAGSSLAKADLTWNGRFLATVTSPWAPVQAQVPADAPVGTAIPVSVLGTDDQGATVTARSAVMVYGTGALLVEAYDDSRGLPLTDLAGSASMDGQESIALDAHGRAALATALPQNWIRVAKPGFTSVWRSAALTVGGVQAVADARLTPLAEARTADSSGFQGDFAGGALHLGVPGGALSGPAPLSVTPLTTQGLPALVPAGWSAVSAWWLDLGGNRLTVPASARLALAQGLPAGATFTWAHWDPVLHAWSVLAAPLTADTLTSLPFPEEGGYALLLADPAPTAPPAAVAGSVLPAFEGSTWQDGLAATGSLDPALLLTVDAINGARATAAFTLAFQGRPALPSGSLIQTDVLESYTLLDQSVIEPDGFTEDAVACRWMLETVDGKPVLTGLQDGLGLRLPVRMSRTFDPAQLVEGRILVGFYHDGAKLAENGAGLIGGAGGSVTQSGITVTLPQGAVSGSTLVRVTPDSGDASALWPELAGQGALARSFSVDVVGTLAAGMAIKLDTLDVPAGARPLLVQRRIVQGQRLLVAMGEMVPQGDAWTLAGANPVLEGGAFAVLVPASPWDWISGTATIPDAFARAMVRKLGAKARMASLTVTDASVADATVDAGFVLAVSGPGGAFAVPALIPSGGTAIPVKGSRWDLGLTGSLAAKVPSQGNALSLSTAPFRVEALIPDPSAPVPVGTVFQIVTTAPADPATLTSVKLQQAFTAADGTTALADVDVARSLSQDGRTLLVTPNTPLATGATYHLLLAGYAGASGDPAPAADIVYTTSATPDPGIVDLGRIKLPYPDADHNILVTIPEGAVPPLAAVEVEAPDMGSVGMGTMHPSGDLEFNLKANLGERLHVRVQLANGRVFEGYLSRYESHDGSGKVTVGIDGGRVEAVDGSGAAVTLPSGTLDHPVELVTRFTDVPSEDLLPEIRATLATFGRVQLLAREPLTFKKLPRIELKAPEGTQDLGVFKGFGSYSVYFRNTDFDTDGVPVTFYEFMDTARIENGSLKGMGGLPWNALEKEMPATEGPATPGVYMLKAPRSAKALKAASDPTEIECSVGIDDFPNATQFSGEGYLGMRSDDSFTVELDGMIVKDPGKVILKGNAFTYMPDGTRIRTVRAPVIYAPAGVDVTISGRMLTRTNECGSYMLMNASFMDQPIQDDGTLLGVEPSYGLKSTRPKAQWNLWQEDKAHDRKLYQIPGFMFPVTPEYMSDHAAPWVDLDFGGGTYLGGGLAMAGTLNSVVAARDGQDGQNLTVELRVDDVAATLCGEASAGGASSSSYTFKSLPGGIGVWTIGMNLKEGNHTVEALVTDRSGNQTRLRKTLQVMDGSAGIARPVDPTKGPTFEVLVTGGRQAAKPDTQIKILFSEPVKNVKKETLYLEKLVGGVWQADTDNRLNVGMVTADSATAAWILPGSMLELNGRYRVVADPSIVDCDPANSGGPRNLQQPPMEFSVLAHIPMGSVFLPGARKVAAMGRSVFAVDGSERINMVLAQDFGLESQTAFGDFQGQSVDAIAAYENADATGMHFPGLLLVTTSPSGSAYSQNCVLWGYEFCASTAQVNPLFSVSLGQFGYGYAPGVDYRDGVIAVARLSGSVALVRLEDAIAKAAYNPSMAVSPAGSGQEAILQPFYLSDPDYQWAEGGTTTLSSGANYGVALAPVSANPGGTQLLRTVVAYGGDYAAQLQGVPIIGLPSFWLPYTPNAAYTPLQPFVADSDSLALSKVRFGAAASAYASTGLVAGGTGASHMVQLWPNASVWIGGEKWTTNLAVGITAAKSLAGGNSLVVMDVVEPDASGRPKMWLWPQVSPFGAGIPYEIQYRKASLDPATGLCAVEVKNLASGSSAWFVLDLTRPENPPVVDTFVDTEGAGWSGAMSYGIFSATSGTGIASWRVVAMQGGAAPAAKLLQAAQDKASEAAKLKAPAKRGARAAKSTSKVTAAKVASQETLNALAYRQEVAQRTGDASKKGEEDAKKTCEVSKEKVEVTLFAVSINQGVEKVIDSSGAAGTDLVTKDLALPHKGKVPVVANRPAKLRVWLANANGKSKVSATVEVTGLKKNPAAKTIDVAVGRPDLYGFKKGGAFVEFDVAKDEFVAPTFAPTITVKYGTPEVKVAKAVTAEVSTNKTVRIYLCPLDADWTPAAPAGAGTLSTSEMSTLRDAVLKRFRAFYPVGMDSEVEVLSAPPSDFPPFTWKLSEGKLQGSLSTILPKWSVHVRRYLNAANLSSDAVRFILVVKPVAGLTHKGESGEGGIATVPYAQPGRPVYLTRLPAIVAFYASLGSGWNGTFSGLESTVEKIFIHELGHSFGRDHQASTQEFSGPNGIESEWPGEIPSAYTTGAATRGLKDWEKAGASRYGDGRVGVPGWDFAPWKGTVGGEAVPFNVSESKAKYTIMAYTNRPWASDFDWSRWSQFLTTASSEFRPRSEPFSLTVTPKKAVVAKGKVLSIKAKVVFNGATSEPVTYQWPAHWEVLKGDNGAVVANELDASYANFTAPKTSGEISRVLVSSEDPTYTKDNAAEFALQTVTVLVGKPVIRPAEDKLMTEDARSLQLFDDDSNKLLDDPDTAWGLTMPPKCTNSADSILTPSDYLKPAPSAAFVAPVKVFDRPYIGAPTDLYTVSATAPAYVNEAGTNNFYSKLSVRDVKIKNVDPAGGKVTVLVGSTTKLKVEVKDGWTNAVEWTVQSGADLGTLNGTDREVREFQAGKMPGTVTIKVASLEKPKVFVMIEVTLIPQPTGGN